MDLTVEKLEIFLGAKKIINGVDLQVRKPRLYNDI